MKQDLESEVLPPTGVRNHFPKTRIPGQLSFIHTQKMPLVRILKDQKSGMEPTSLRLVGVVSDAEQQVAMAVELDVAPAVTARQPLQKGK
jgi:hypothetical protein